MKTPIVIDNGSAFSRAGFAGMVDPTVVVASALGTKRSRKASNILDEMTHIVGSHDDLLKNSSTHDFNFMFANGLVKDWDALERLWHSCIFEKLKCSPEDHCFVLSESPFNSPESREQMAEIMFETFNVPGLYIGIQPILSLVASWGSVNSKLQQLSGTVVDCGDGRTTVVPIADGHILRHCIQQMPIGGRDVTSFVQERLRLNNRSVPPSQSFEISRQIKENYSYVGSSVEKAKQKEVEQIVSGTYAGQDPWSCTVCEERYLSGEVLFRPSLLSGPKSRLPPLTELVDKTIQDCPIDARRLLYGNVVLSGGATMVPDFGRRLQRDLETISNSRLQESRSAARVSVSDKTQVDVNVVGHAPQSHSAWLGGSIVGSDDRFHEWMMTRADYEEVGPSMARQNAGVYCTDSI